MIMADVYVPSIGRQYDFSLDEQATIAHLIPVIAEVICKKENCTLGGSEEELLLCLMDVRQILDKKKSLSNYWIGNGCSLLLVYAWFLCKRNNDCLNGKARSDYQQKLCTGCLSGKYAVHQFFPQEHHACDNV